MNRFGAIFLGLVLVGAFSDPALAQAPAPTAAQIQAATAAGQLPSFDHEPNPDSITTLKILKSKGAAITYIGRLFSLDGWLISKGTDYQIVYTTLDGQATVEGLLFGPNGNSYTTIQLAAARAHGVALPIGNDAAGAAPVAADQPPAAAPQVIPASSPADQTPPSERLWNDVNASTYITFGPDSAPPLYVFMDPKCHFCHDYFTDLARVYLPQNKVQLRVIPVGILGDDSVDLAKKVLSSDDPVSAWRLVEAGKSPAPKDIKADVADKLAANENLMLKWKLDGTPGTVFRNKDGKVQLVYGMPHDLSAMVTSIGPGQAAAPGSAPAPVKN